VIADKEYFKSEEILACHKAGITAYVPKAMASGAKFDGRFDNDEFVYDSTRNVDICPAQEVLTWRSSYVEKGMTLHRYWTNNRAGCALKALCTPAPERRLRRWEHEAVLEKNVRAAQQRAADDEYPQTHG
jgi:hypothetical protein